MEGFKGITVMDVVGRGREGGIQVGDKNCDELAKTLIMIAVEDEYSDKVVDIITKHANTGMFGDGKVFVCQLEEVWTIRTKKEGGAPWIEEISSQKVFWLRVVLHYRLPTSAGHKGK